LIRDVQESDAAIAATPRLKPAGYFYVAPLDGPMRAQHATLLALSVDARLKAFGVAAGLPAPGRR
jgi:hypothetical protein